MAILLDENGDALLDENDEPIYDETGPPVPTDPSDPPPITDAASLIIAPTSFPYVRLEAPGVEPLTFDQSAGWYVDRIDLGSVDKRDQSQPAPDSHGTIDPTSLVGARDVIVTGWMVPDVEELWQMRERLAAFESQRIRSTITFRESESAPERMVRRCRAVQIPTRFNDAPVDTFRAVFRVERGVIESTALNVRDVFASGAGLTAGRTYPLVYPRSYPIAAPVGSTVLVNAGKFDASPVLRVFGACADLTIENRTLGRAITFRPGFAVNAGEYLEIDVAARTVRLNGDPVQSRQGALDFAVSRWWWLAPGANDVRFVPGTYTPGARVEVAWRDTWLG